jgi:hypothetical protein
MKICECVVQLGAEDPISGMPRLRSKYFILVLYTNLGLALLLTMFTTIPPSPNVSHKGC